MIAELQVVPSPTGTHDDKWAYVDAAIAVIVDSGLAYEVGSLGTTVEGPPEAVWAVIRRAHEATIGSGASGVISVVKLYETRDPADTATIADLTIAYRPTVPQ